MEHTLTTLPAELFAPTADLERGGSGGSGWRSIASALAVCQHPRPVSPNEKNGQPLTQGLAVDTEGATETHFFVDSTGTMMCAYGVPVHITHGPPLWRVVGSPSSAWPSGTTSMMWGGSNPHSLSGVCFAA